MQFASAVSFLVSLAQLLTSSLPWVCVHRLLHGCKSYFSAVR